MCLNPEVNGPGASDGAVIPDEYVDAITAASEVSGIPVDVLAAQIKAESNWDPTAVSGAGARGIAQFMPGTWASYGHGADPFDGQAGIRAQGEYMRDLMKQVADLAGGDEQKQIKYALASYNAGPGRVLAAGGIPDIEETQNYVKKIMADADIGFAGCVVDIPGSIELGPGEWAPVVPGARLTSAYGPRGCPFASCASRPYLLNHDGIDLAGGTPHFYAPTDMRITHVGGPGDRVYPFYGNYIFAVQLDPPHLVFEFHEAADGSVLVQKGDVVRAGAPLGLQGATGNSSGVHVHFQVDKPGTDVSGPGFHSGETLDPIPILRQKGVAP
nr:transglycosylase SLT domain-containing protein [Pseudactinotalea sp. HY160]